MQPNLREIGGYSLFGALVGFIVGLLIGATLGGLALFGLAFGGLFGLVCVIDQLIEARNGKP